MSEEMDTIMEPVVSSCESEIDINDDFQQVKSKRPKKNVSFNNKTDAMETDHEFIKPAVPKPQFKPCQKICAINGEVNDIRKIFVPDNRLGPLRDNWMKIFTPIVEHLTLQIRFCTKTRVVEIKNSPQTTNRNALQKAEDFVKAFVLGFNVEDALSLIRLEEMFLETFEVSDVKSLKGAHMSRAIARIAGKKGQTKHSIENVTRTRIVLADTKIHLLGSYENIRAARTTISSLILGSPPSKVYGNLNRMAQRSKERF